MKRNQTTEGRISNHTKGLGTVTREMVQIRARELAIINGRSADQVTKADEDQARDELMGVDPAAVAREAEEALPESMRWDPVPGSTGYQANAIGLEDEQPVAERLVESGMEEAEHNLMVEGTEESAKRDQL